MDEAPDKAGRGSVGPEEGRAEPPRRRGRRARAVDDAGQPFAPWAVETPSPEDAVRPEVQSLLSAVTQAAMAKPTRLDVAMTMAWGFSFFVIFSLPIGLTLRYLLFAAGVVAGVPLLRANGRRRMTRAADVVSGLLVERGLCGSCAYSLQNLPRDESALVRCPECGAGWCHARVRTFVRSIRWVDGSPLERKETGRIRQVVRTRFADDRYAPVVLVTRKDVVDPGASLERRTRLSRARHQISITGLGLDLATALVQLCVIIAVFALIVIPWIPRRAGTPAIGGIVPPVVAAIVAASVTYMLFWRLRQIARGWIGKPRRLVRAVMLAEHLCPSCGADLETSDAPVTCCPRCAASWLNRDITTRQMEAMPLSISQVWRLAALQRRESINTKVVTDDRGRLTRLASTATLAFELRFRPRRGRQTLELARSALRFNGGVLRGLSAMLVLIPAVAGFPAIFVAWSQGSPGVPKATLVLPMLLLVLVWGVLVSDVARSPQRAKRDLLARLLCPRCTEDLTGVQPDASDGCTVCPCCGAAWQLPASQSPRQDSERTPGISGNSSFRHASAEPPIP